jgi:hypothetical protein
MEGLEYDIAISYAGEDLETASRLAEMLQEAGVSVYFSNARQARMVGERLEQVLSRIFGGGSLFVIALISGHYSEKDWPRFELQAARAEEKRRGGVVILPVLVAEAKLEELPSDKVYLDLRRISIEEAAAILVAKVKQNRGETLVPDSFENHFREWKLCGALPSPAQGSVFYENIAVLNIDVDRCEFLLKSPSASFEPGCLQSIDRQVLVSAAERLVLTAETPGSELAAIGYLGSVDPFRAEEHLWRIYENVELHVNDRARAFELFWLCPSPRSKDEPARILGDLLQPWIFRQAAMTNVLWAERNLSTEGLVSRGLRDPRSEVRAKAVDAVLHFRLETLASELMESYLRARSAKGRNKIKSALRHFNNREDVRSFGIEHRFAKSFFSPPPYVHDWEQSRPGWV